MTHFAEGNFHSRIYLLFFYLLWLLTIAPCPATAGTPSFMGNPESINRVEGEEAVLFCSVLNLGDNTVTWRKLPRPSPLTIGVERFSKDTRINAEHVPNSSQWNLVINQVKMEDAGVYECQISTRPNSLRRPVTLVIRAKPISQIPRIEISGENVVKAGSTLTLTCNASVVDAASERVDWLKDGSSLRLDSDSRYRIHTFVTSTGQNSGTITSRLEVTGTKVSDSGAYLCKSSERAQMAGVKVDVQSVTSNKRADGQDPSSNAYQVTATKALRSGARASLSYVDFYSKISVLLLSCIFNVVLCFR